MEDRLLVRDKEDQEKTINKTNEKDFQSNVLSLDMNYDS